MFNTLYMRRKNVFDNLNYYIRELKNTVMNMDPEAEIYEFGSTVNGNYNMASDIDILIVTDKKEDIIKALWNADFKEPFEFHIRTPDESSSYFSHVKEIKKIN